MEHNSSHRGVQYGLRIYSDTLSHPISPIETLRSKDSTETRARWFDENGKTALRCMFLDPIRPGIARLQYQHIDSRLLWFEVAFDFESQPCLLVRSNSDRVYFYKQSKIFSVYRLSTVIEEEVKVIDSDWEWQEVEMLKVKDSASGSVSYFLRCKTDRRDISAQNPAEMALGADPVWVRFMYLHKDLDVPGLWVLTFSSRRPNVGDDVDVGNYHDLLYCSVPWTPRR
jgi:hypothetical protein